MASETNDIVAEKLHIWYHGGKSAKKSPETRMIPNFRTYYEVKADDYQPGFCSQAPPVKPLGPNISSRIGNK